MTTKKKHPPKQEKAPAETRKQVFIRQLARFLCGNLAAKSILLKPEFPRMPVPWQDEWAAMRQATPLLGWSNEEEAIKILTEFLA